MELARALKIETIAEGIETEHQLERLRGERCAQGQGFLFARPMSAEATEEFLAGRTASSPTVSEPAHIVRACQVLA